MLKLMPGPLQYSIFCADRAALSNSWWFSQQIVDWGRLAASKICTIGGNYTSLLGRLNEAYVVWYIQCCMCRYQIMEGLR